MDEAAPLMVSVSGVRGIVGKSMTPEVACRFAGAFGGWLRERAAAAQKPERWLAKRGGAMVVVGADGRAGWDVLMGAAIAGLRGAGCGVIDIGIATTPTVAVAVDENEADGGLVMTASHNPQEWNGLKCLVRTDGEAVSTSAPAAAVAEEIIGRFQNGRVGAVGWEHLGREGDDDSPVPTHLGRVTRNVGVLGLRAGIVGRAHRVVLDSVNASGAVAGRKLLDELGCGVVHLNGSWTGTFPHPPEPTRENLTDLCIAVREHRAEIGFAQDPDADRLAIVDERGDYIGEEYTLVLAAMALLGAGEASGGEQTETLGAQASPPPHGGLEARPTFQRLNRVICVNLSTSRMIDDVAAMHGVRVVRTTVGEANVVEAMKREAAAGAEVVLGGEGNGGVIWPRVTYVRDSLSAMALVLALMARTGKTVSELVSEVPAYAIEKRKVGLARREDADRAVEAVAEAYKKERVDRQDGVRVDFDSERAWLHVRASNTEPIMRLIAEAPTEGGAKRVLDEAERVIQGGR